MASSELHVAVVQKDTKKVKKLLKSKKVRQYLLSYDLDESTPFNIALRNNDLEYVDLFLAAYKENKVDINTKDKRGYTALHQAVQSDDKVLMRVLRSDLGIDVDVENADKNRPLHYFCQSFKSPNCSEPFQQFLERGCNVNAQNNNGEAPLHKAIFNNYVRMLMVDMLLKNGANVNLTNAAGESALHYAVRLGRDDLVSVLLKAGADVTIQGNKERKSLYQLALDEHHKEMANRIRKHKELLDWLHELSLDSYAQQFVKEELYLDILIDATEKTLEKMGIATGHRLKLMKAIKELKEERDSEFVGSDAGPNPSEEMIKGLHDELKNLYLRSGPAPIIQDMELEFTEKLGAGSSGKVYKGLFKGNEVAIKVLKSTTEAKDIDEFKKEFAIMSNIKSTCVVLFYGAVLEPKLCMVMEYCSRGSLYHVLTSDKYEIGWDRVFRFAIEATRGIDQLHNGDPQIVHRDLKSLNLLVNEKWDVKVCDFGLSRFTTGTNLETLMKMRGTFAYCAPEVYFGEQFSTKSDVYSLGIVFWELVVRCIMGHYERPFAEFKNLQFDFQIIIQTAKKGLRPTIPDCCPEGWKTLMKECVDPTADKRPSCKEILVKLEELEKDWKANEAQWEAAKVKEN